MRIAKHLCSLCLLAAVIVSSAQAQSGGAPLTNADVIALVQAGLDSDLIMQKIRTAPAKNFDTSVPALKMLNDAKVPSAVIRFMITGKEDDPSTSGAMKFKDGLWEAHTVSESTTLMAGSNAGGPRKTEEVMQMCRDQRFSIEGLSKLMMRDMPSEACNPTTEHVDASTIRVTMQCNQSTPQGQSKMSMTETLQQVDEEHTRATVKMTMHASMQGHDYSMDSNSNVDMSWKGACPADMKPGDEKGPDGTINHFADRERIRSQRGLHPQ